MIAGQAIDLNMTQVRVASINTIVGLTYHEVANYRWQGYRRFAVWLASDPNFAIGRNYADLRVLIRLHKQRKVEKLKARLQELDKQRFEREQYLPTSIERDFEIFGGEGDKLIQELELVEVGQARPDR